MNNKSRLDVIASQVSQFHGYLGKEEGKFLYRLAKKCTGRGVIVEIGSWKGKSTTWLANGSKDGCGAKVYAIDPHTGSPEHKEEFGEVDTFKEFEENITSAGIRNFVEPLRKTSEDAAQQWNNEPIELLWVDGDHAYDMVKLDFELWEPFVVEGGIIAFHDTGLRGGKDREGPKQFVEQYVFKSDKFKNIGFLETITFATKVSRNTLGDQIKNRFTLLVKRVYQWLRWQMMYVPKPRFLKQLVNRIIKSRVS